MPIIESVSVAACEIPLDHVTSFSTRTVSARHYGLVKIRSVLMVLRESDFAMWGVGQEQSLRLR